MISNNGYCRQKRLTSTTPDTERSRRPAVSALAWSTAPPACGPFWGPLIGRLRGRRRRDLIADTA
jgi:hypothetical protein